MAVRIRKLAKQLDRTPRHLIGVLHAIGYARYRSPDDMLSGTVEAKLRRGLAQGVRPVAVDVPEPRRRPDSLEALASTQRDVMADLVPGVVRQGREGSVRSEPAAEPTVAPPSARPVAPPPASPVAPSTTAAPPAPRADDVDVEGERQALALEREALASRRRTLDSEAKVLEAQRFEVDSQRRRIEAKARAVAAQQESLAHLRSSLERERAALDAERATSSVAPDTRTLQSLLEDRGLRGADEFVRALDALARGRHLDDVFWALTVEAPDVVARVLDERLLLVAGEVPDSVSRGLGVVAVAEDRADIPPMHVLGRELGRAGEALLLAGCRRLVVVGGRPRWQRVLRDGLDSRIEVRFVVGARPAERVDHDAEWADVVVLWEPPGDEVRRAFVDGRARVIEATGTSPADVAEAIRAGLAR